MFCVLFLVFFAVLWCRILKRGFRNPLRASDTFNHMYFYTLLTPHEQLKGWSHPLISCFYCFITSILMPTNVRSHIYIYMISRYRWNISISQKLNNCKCVFICKVTISKNPKYETIMSPCSLVNPHAFIQHVRRQSVRRKAAMKLKEEPLYGEACPDFWLDVEFESH